MSYVRCPLTLSAEWQELTKSLEGVNKNMQDTRAKFAQLRTAVGPLKLAPLSTWPSASSSRTVNVNRDYQGNAERDRDRNLLAEALVLGLLRLTLAFDSFHQVIRGRRALAALPTYYIRVGAGCAPAMGRRWRCFSAY